MIIITIQSMNYYAPPSFNNGAVPSAPPHQQAPPQQVLPQQFYNLNSDVPAEIVNDVNVGKTEIVRQGMDGHEARVCLILDVSASMQNPNQFFFDEYKGNQVQLLINKALALAFLFDDNQSIEVFPFGDVCFPHIAVDRNNFIFASDLCLQASGGYRPTTNYSSAVQAIRKHYFNDSGQRSKPQLCNDPPVFVIFITDGEPNVKKTEAMNEFASASHQAIFFKFIALKGKQSDLEFKYLQSIDDHDVKVKKNKHESNDLFYIDNSDLVVLNNPDELTMEHLIHEYRGWLLEAKETGLLFHDQNVKGGLAKTNDGRTVHESSKCNIL